MRIGKTLFESVVNDKYIQPFRRIHTKALELHINGLKYERVFAEQTNRNLKLYNSKGSKRTRRVKRN
jgi:hypothetical protein